MKNKYTKPLIVIVAFLILALTTVASYAYFSASVNGNNDVYNTVITSGTMQLLLTDGEQVALDNAYPGNSIAKTFKVKNIGTVSTTYDVYLSELVNEFADKNDLVYTLSSANGCANNIETVVPSEVGEPSKIISSCAINPNIEHEYTLTITFKEDGTNQDDNKGKLFEAKISVNEYQLGKMTIAAKMIYLASNGVNDLEYDGVETLGEYGTPDNNLRYIGATPNNYIYYNCSTTNPSEMNDATCEKWRIIGLMNNIEDENGNIASLVKIMRYETLGYYSWDSSNSSINGGYGINQWGESESYEGADLMRELNTDYLGNITVGTDGKWFNSYYNKKEQNMPTSILNNNAKNMIQEVKWYTGSNSKESNDLATNMDYSLLKPKNTYEYERSNNTSKICKQGNSKCNDEVVRTTEWIGKVALMYPSDYFYATSGGTTLNKNTCLNTEMHLWYYRSDIEGITDCYQNTWIYNETYMQWTLSPFAVSTNASTVSFISDFGSVYGGNAYNNYEVRPVVFLKSNVLVDSGDGSSTNPYKLTM